MTKKYGFGSAVGDFIGAIFAVPTYGASLTMSPTARGIVAKIIGSGGGDDNDNTNKKLEEWKIQNEQWKAQMEANRAEVERLRKEREENDKQVKHNNNEVERLRAIINNPHSTDEEKNNAKKRIVLLEDEVRQLKNKNKKIDEDITNKSKTPLAPSKPWSFPKLSLVDKALIAGGAVLLIYLLIPEKKKS